MGGAAREMTKPMLRANAMNRANQARGAYFKP
jgi:hypothetical protein